MINDFRNQYYFLSNFYNVPIEYEGITYRNNEAAFQAQKTLDLKERQKFSELNPSMAKLNGRNVILRKDWEQIKDNIMYNIVMNKFTQNEILRKLLLKIKSEYLEEGNWWHDNYWGNCYCDKCKKIQGKNNLGKILMQVRTELEKE